MTRNSRSTACAEGSSLPPGFLRRTYFSLRRDQLIGRIGLAALELVDGQRAGIAFDVRAQPRVERGFVELVALLDGLDAFELGVGVFGVGHLSSKRR